MLDQLISFILGIIEDFKFWYFVRQWERGVLLRGGKLIKEVGPGPHLKIPFLDEANIEEVIMTTSSLPPQSLTTLDNKEVVVRAAISYYTEDLTKKVTTIWDSNDVVSDLTQGIIKKIIVSSTFEETKNPQVDQDITVKARALLKKYGIYVDRVTLTDVSRSRSFRLFNDNIQSIV